MSNCTQNNATGLTLQEWVNEYLEVYVKPVCKPSSTAYFADNLLKHAVPALGDMLQILITRQTICKKDD